MLRCSHSSRFPPSAPQIKGSSLPRHVAALSSPDHHHSSGFTSPNNAVTAGSCRLFTSGAIEYADYLARQTAVVNLNICHYRSRRAVWGATVVSFLLVRVHFDEENTVL